LASPTDEIIIGSTRTRPYQVGNGNLRGA